jgi:hypothetical protein
MRQMAKKMLVTVSVGALMLAASAGSAYDTASVGGYAQLFAQVKGVTAGKGLHFMTVPPFVDLVKGGLKELAGYLSAKTANMPVKKLAWH